MSQYENKISTLSTGSSLAQRNTARTITEQEAQDAALSFLQQRHAGTTKAKADKVYNLQGQQQKSLQKGINIIKMNNGSVKKVMVK